MPEGTKAALTSVTYNYGRLPASVTRAAITGDPANIAAAIRGLKANPERRQREASLVGKGAAEGETTPLAFSVRPQGAPPPAPVPPSLQQAGGMAPTGFALPGGVPQPPGRPHSRSLLRHRRISPLSPRPCKTAWPCSRRRNWRIYGPAQFAQAQPAALPQVLRCRRDPRQRRWRRLRPLRCSRSQRPSQGLWQALRLRCHPRFSRLLPGWHRKPPLRRCPCRRRGWTPRGSSDSWGSRSRPATLRTLPWLTSS